MTGSAEIAVEWRGDVSSSELNSLHAEAFSTRLFTDDEWPWARLLQRHSLGWVTARDHGTLVGFVNVVWDGLVHAWLQDTMVASAARHRGVGSQVVAEARARAAAAGCEYLHVDFDDDLRDFYLGACGFTEVPAGLIHLQE